MRFREFEGEDPSEELLREQRQLEKESIIEKQRNPLLAQAQKIQEALKADDGGQVNAGTA